MKKEIVLITGASSGFGYLASLHLASKGYYVLASMRDLNKGDQLLQEAKDKGIEQHIEVVKLDVTKRDEILSVKNYVLENFGQLDILINNAGYCLGGMMEYANLDEWEHQFDTNVLSVIAVTKAFIPMMRQRRKGKIINLGSISGRFGFPGMGAYTTSKFALSGISESLRLELAQFKIHVSIIEAGSFKTNIWEKSLGNIDLNYDDDYKSITQRIYKQAKQTAEQSDHPMKVVQLIEKICVKKKPKLRYPIGKGVKLMILLKALLPWSFIERMVLKELK